jgi:hypothetical protein
MRIQRFPQFHIFHFASLPHFALIFQRFSPASPLICLQYPPAGCTVNRNVSETDFLLDFAMVNLPGYKPVYL